MAQLMTNLLFQDYFLSITLPKDLVTQIGQTESNRIEKISGRLIRLFDW